MHRAILRNRAPALILAALMTLYAFPAAPCSAESDSVTYSFKYSNGLQFKRNDGMFKIKFGGRIQADFASIHADSALEAAVPGGDGEGVEFRRTRLYVSGDLYDRIIFKAQYDFADSENALNDLYIGMKNLGPLGTVRVGHMKEPYSLEELASSKYITFMERALPLVFDSSRNFGIAANNYHLDQRLTWALGIFAPTDRRGDFFNAGGGSMNISGRITGLHHYAEDGRKLLHLGLSLSRRIRPGSSQILAQQPEVHLAKSYLVSNEFGNNGSTLLAAEAAWVYGPFSLQAEYKHGWVNPVGEPTSSLKGGYAQASWFATGENRAYKTKSGIFGRVSPKNPFDPSKGDWGAVELKAATPFSI